MMRNYYVVCKTTHYGYYNTPIWVELDHAEAKKIKDQLQRLYDKKAASGKPNMFTRDIASIFKVEGSWYDYDTEKLIFQHKPLYCETDLISYIRLYKERNATDRQVFLLDIEKELEEAEAAASDADDDNYDEYI